MTLEEFVQKLEKANPWTREKIEVLLGIKFTKTVPGDRTDYIAYEQFEYVKGLIIKDVDLEVQGGTKETHILTLTLDNKSSCFTWEQIEKSYPGGYSDPVDEHMREVSYVKKQPWGELGFVFGYTKKGECLIEIMIATNAWIKKRDKPSPTLDYFLNNSIKK